MIFVSKRMSNIMCGVTSGIYFILNETNDVEKAKTMSKYLLDLFDDSLPENDRLNALEGLSGYMNSEVDAIRKKNKKGE